MDTDRHFAKAQRIERTMSKLDQDDDYETVIENCMLAGTHYLNGALHALGLLDVADDLLHSDKPTLDATVPSWLAPAFSSMKYIEDLRPPLVRGSDPYDPEAVAKCLEGYALVRQICSSAVSRSAIA